MQWQGRIDGPGSAHLRLHQRITPFTTKQQRGIVLLGFACDEGILRNQGRIGAASAPDAIRAQLANMVIHQQFYLYDAGNLNCVDHDLEQAQQQLAHTVSELLTQGHFPIVLGGGHEMAYGDFLGVFHAYAQKPASIGIINFDAHFDLREQDQSTSGNSFAQAASFMKDNKHNFHYLCLGICEHSNTKALFDKAHALQVDYILDKDLSFNYKAENILQIDQFLEKVDIIYLSIDLDVFSYSQAPGVSAPAVLGVPLTVVEQLLAHIFLSKKVCLVDIAECNPHLDIGHQTARLAAYLTMEIINNHCKNF